MTIRNALLCLCLSALAALPPGPPAQAQGQGIAPEAARKYVENLGNRTVDALKPGAGAQGRNARFAAIMLDTLDFDAIGTQAIGKMARTATPEQKRQFTPLFAAYVIDVAIAKFGDLELKSFGLGSSTAQPNGDARVFTRVNIGEGPIEVYWRVRNTSKGPRVNDIDVAGASLTLHYRGEFERAGVATVPQLIARLRELTKDSKSLPTVQQAMR